MAEPTKSTTINPEIDAVEGGVEEEEEKADAPFIPTSNFTIAIHTILNNAQQSHGLVPHNDYTQYRTYLTKRLARIRHAKPVIKSLSHGPKSKRDVAAATAAAAAAAAGSTHTSSKKGGKHSFQPRDEITIEKASSHINYILDGIYSIERSWAHSMELKSLYEDVIANANQNSGGSSSSSLKKKKTSPGKIRQHYINQLRKAVKYVENLEKIVIKGVCDEKTCLEMNCYGAWMKGNYYCEVNQWEDACKQYALSLQLCYQIAKSTKSKSSLDLVNDYTTNTTTTTTTTTAAESLQTSDFFHSRGTNIIQPLLRYCKYELEQEGKLSKEDIIKICHVPILQYNEDDDDDGDDNELIQQKKLQEESSEIITSITFRGETISIDEPNVKMTLIKLNTAKEEYDSLSKPSISSKGGAKKKKVKASVKDAKFMQLLNCYDDAVDVVSKILQEYNGMSSGPSVNRKRLECSLLIGYFKFTKIQMLMKRNEKMVNVLRDADCEMALLKKGRVSDSCGTHNNKSATLTTVTKQEDADAKYKRVEEIAHLYDALLQDAKSIVLLPGGDNNDDVEDDFVLEANANVLRIRALRCYYIGRMYAADTVAKYNEALALFEQSHRLASEAAEEIAACQDMDDADDLIESMAMLQKEIAVMSVRTKASAFLASRCSEASSVTTGLTLLRRLDDFDAGGKTYRIADIPPVLEPIACKAAFFDVANNFVREYPTDALEEYAKSLKEKRSRGFMSWFH